MKPIRIVIPNTQDTGTWVDTIPGPTETYAVIVLDNGNVVALWISSIQVLDARSVQMRALS